MKKIFLYIVILLLAFNVSAQVTIVVDKLPEETPKDASIFISGGFEDWTGGQDKYKLEKKEGTYLITLQTTKNLLFKFTQGSWQSVECNNKGEAIDNRNFIFEKPNDTIHVEIEGWSNSFDLSKASTAAKNVSIISEEFYLVELNRKRRIWLYLPPDYYSSNASYPVVYMHDGQNLFDNKTAYSGEWNADETMNTLFRDHNLKLIIVGIDNGSDKRLDEYSPWTNTKYGGGEGEAYINFIKNTLKPFIDTNYNTLTDNTNTAIIGSSMGGLISHYAALKYPNIFGKAAIFSPSYWFAPKKVSEFSEANANNKTSKLYFLAGGKEGNNVAFNEISQTAKDMNSMVELLKTEGFSAENIQSKVTPEGKHNEKFWREEFKDAILWLFPEAIKKRQFVSANQTNAGLEIKVSDGTYNIQFYTKDIVETSFIPEGETVNNESHAIILNPTELVLNFDDDDEQLRFTSKGLSVKIDKNPFKIAYEYNGKPIVSERNGYQKNDAFETIQFGVTDNEVLYGGGARALGMNRRGNRLRLYNKAHYGYETESKLMNYTMPIVMSSNKYMLHFDNAPIGYLDLDSRSDNTVTYETISGRKIYQVIAGESWYDILDSYTDLTGKQPMLPRWALGNFSSRFGYHSQQETTETINTFREEEIPVDAIILDLFWFGKDLKGTMGNLEFHKDSFPNPTQMIKNLRFKDVKTILITEPYILTTSNRWEEAVKENILAKDSIGNPATYDFYFGNTGIIDIYNPKGNQWFKNIYKDLSQLGVNGFWGDLGEPEVHPSWVQHTTGSADEIHNIYGHDWAKLVYDASIEANPNSRPFILMRAGYSGSQRYGMVPWSGDVNRTWGGLQSQPEIALQMGMQGLAYMHSDLGGFAGDNLDDELYVRWLQYGIFQPIFRPHAQESVPSEPVFRSEKAKVLAKEAVELRYRFLPYNYDLMFDNNQTGAPLMRPLFFENTTNSKLSTYSSSYFWGEDILVTPILNAAQKEQTIYFPKSSDWFDFYSTNQYKGGTQINYKLNENTIPTFVRAGAFLPMSKTIQSTSAYDPNDLIVHYFFNASTKESVRHFYNDDGKTNMAFEKGMYELLEFKSTFKASELKIEMEAKIGRKFLPQNKNIALVIHNITKLPKRIKLGNKKVKGTYNSKKKTLTIPVKWNTSKDLKIKLKLN
ncbi:glycoside hydrolase family 31 protein [Ichthyenterobacterium sp. W332]|uniref:Glycoside hydrolase family 31 protein n=1 Tax=Microcosmobacter mediterraneus TaxID=3075607 RepID=A0ABU2YM01_9FLAO|nr:TIM-barrel domain-containing protein [Ichthyenterobacterium sp. W332]MDT0558926.1 glycoside hydrolase family 31 protein [Ichthyenterobacterium sp. W332]